METSIVLFSMASPISVRSVSARFNDADSLKERVHTEFTERGEGTKNSKSHMKQ
jgi:hypothetical protein